ncbi:MAG: hypothetical protein JST79_17955 [Acidobacteria bacterium]|nr:hypothetical protein [Acidobacteriota bacterium]
MDQTLNLIDTDKFSAHLRDRAIQPGPKRVLVTKFGGSQQEQDLTLPPNCGGFGRIHHFKRSQEPPWPDNPLPIAPAARALGLNQAEAIKAQVFQNAVCSWRCWYCFVDFDLLSANLRFSEFKTADELLDLYLVETNRPGLIDLSGGQPDLVPEWSLWFVEAIERRGISDLVYVWSDDNLSNDYLWRFLSAKEISKLATCSRYGRVGCFKGFDEISFSFNTKAKPELFSQQFKLMSRLVNAGFDVYGYATFTSPDGGMIHTKMADFVDRLQTEIHPNFPLRTVPLRILPFTPTRDRLGTLESRSLGIQTDAVIAWSEELRKRFSNKELVRNVTDQNIR